jgi:hypothetical protein
VAKETVTASWSPAHFDFLGLASPAQNGLLASLPLAGFVSLLQN